MQKERIILGIDPGTNIMGYGLIKVENTRMDLITLGVIKLGAFEGQALKLRRIFERVLSLVDQYHPDEVALEAPFFGKNVQSMLKLGRAQGVAMAAALFRDVPIVEYSPRKIKQAITGNGNATKEQVALMLARVLPVDSDPQYFDATDGLAAAVCHYYQRNTAVDDSGKGKKVTGWAKFISENPNRKL